MKPETLLYVEDDDDNWEVAQLRLSKCYELLRARTDVEACNIVRERRQDIDVILMDIELRGSQLNGVELTELLRGSASIRQDALPEYARDLKPLAKPILYVTANGARHSELKLKLSGADKVIPKPVDFRQLRMALAELLLERTAV